jgi:hypothetical protein
MRDKHLLKFFSGISILTVILTGIALVISHFFYVSFCLDHFLINVFCFLIVTSLFHTIQIRIIDTKPRKFEKTFLIFTISKILIYMLLLVIYILSISTGTKCFLISFLVLYLSYTIFEVSFLSSYLKNTNNS